MPQSHRASRSSIDVWINKVLWHLQASASLASGGHLPKQGPPGAHSCTASHARPTQQGSVCTVKGFRLHMHAGHMPQSHRASRSSVEMWINKVLWHLQASASLASESQPLEQDPSGAHARTAPHAQPAQQGFASILHGSMPSPASLEHASQAASPRSASRVPGHGSARVPGQAVFQPQTAWSGLARTLASSSSQAACPHQDVGSGSAGSASRSRSLQQGSAAAFPISASQAQPWQPGIARAISGGPRQSVEQSSTSILTSSAGAFPPASPHGQQQCPSSALNDIVTAQRDILTAQRDILTAQQAALLSSDAQDRMTAARLILDLLLGHPDLQGLTEAVVSHQLHATFIRFTARDVSGHSEIGLQEVSLRVLHILASQPALQTRLLASGICESLSDALHSLLSSFPWNGIPAVVVAALGHLCLAGAP